MLSVYDLKSRFQALLRPIVSSFAVWGMTANQVTIGGLLLSVMGGVFIIWQPQSSWPLFVFPLVLLVRMALNAIDGMLAREYGQQSALGAILNEICDVLADAVLYLPLALISGISGILVVVLVVMAGVSEMMGVVALEVGAKRQYQGPMGKSDRALWLSIVALVLACGIQAELWINIVLGLMVFLLMVTIVNRAKGALKESVDAHHAK